MNKKSCDRGADLMTFLYDEADEREAREFKRHLNECDNCREEAAALGLVRESITAWRDEALSGFVSAPIAPKRKSALAAVRQFFDLSPLWLKAATGFAALIFCALAALALIGIPQGTEHVSSNPPQPAAVYTQQDVDRLIKEALAKQEPTEPEKVKQPEAVAVRETPKPRNSKTPKPTEVAKSRRPLSRAEREQLAADLRLLSTGDDSGLVLLGDRINQ